MTVSKNIVFLNFFKSFTFIMLVLLKDTLFYIWYCWCVCL